MPVLKKRSTKPIEILMTEELTDKLLTKRPIEFVRKDGTKASFKARRKPKRRTRVEF
jgi:hypothetical protein